jgi:hypothetical protein
VYKKIDSIHTKHEIYFCHERLGVSEVYSRSSNDSLVLIITGRGI